MTPEQVRAARGWLNWTQAELAERAQVGLSTVKDYEAGRRNPIQNNLLAIIAALESAGISFGSRAVYGPLATTAGEGQPYEFANIPRPPDFPRGIRMYSRISPIAEKPKTKKSSKKPRNT
jgi:transcriptional regulator with XRE-family HTH domain